ncbi:Zinc finger AN1 and C2H2 domain-containing stress-associated protein 13 [Halotydeus destructor]|nr:Zinc finger AN1 and C2H2 domain-containing stress-associated protein 13 [Halotydeus destructor]
MAEFPELGEACKVCNNLDFLPFICVYCREILCKEHREVLSHNCPKYEETNVNINEKPNSSAYEKCSFCAAKVKNKHELVQCEKCSLAHCLAHRHAEGHDCVKLKEETLKGICC